MFLCTTLLICFATFYILFIVVQKIELPKNAKKVPNFVTAATSKALSVFKFRYQVTKLLSFVTFSPFFNTF